MLPRVCVVVVTYNGRQYLPDLLSSLRQVDYAPERWSLVVVDNASRDDSAEVAAYHRGVVVLRQPSNLGFAAANNVGIRYALERGFDFVFLLNQDTVVTRGFLQEVVGVAAEKPDIAAVQSKLLLHDTQLINSWGNELHYLGFGYAGGHRLTDRELLVREIAYPSGAAVLLRSSALREVGLLCEDFFMYHEDLELGWRLWISGYRCVVAPASVVYHKYEFSRSVAKYYWMEQNRYLTVLTCYRVPTLLLLWPVSIAVDFGLLWQAARGGYLSQELAAQSCMLKLSTWRWVLHRRRFICQLRRRQDREVITRFTSEIRFQDLPESPLLKFGNRVMRAYWRMVRPMIWW